jgi:hypothetical protein
MYYSDRRKKDHWLTYPALTAVKRDKQPNHQSERRKQQQRTTPCRDDGGDGGADGENNTVALEHFLQPSEDHVHQSAEGRRRR